MFQLPLRQFIVFFVVVVVFYPFYSITVDI